MVVPNGKTVYGSASTVVLNDPTNYCYKPDKFSQVIYITRTHIKALDQPSQRCSQGNNKISTSACIAKFLENKLGCNPMVLGSQFSETPYCTTKDQLLAFVNASKAFEDADENDIYEMTGCLPTCENDQFNLILDPIRSQTEFRYRCEVNLEFIMLDSSYKEEKQYVIYDVNSFVADVGGYMGLLLGSSLLSLYMAMEAYMRKLLCQPIKSKIDA